MQNSRYVNLATQIRINVLEMVHRAKASHIGSAMSIVDILSVLYNFEGLDLTAPCDISNRDSFILSKGHACTALYSTLFVTEHLTRDLILSYGDNGSPLMHHVSHKVPFIDFSSGSLGHGLPVTVGLAKADQINGKINKRICLIGDGELAEGANWEALLFAAHHKLKNLILIVDWNNLQSLDTVESTLNISPIADKITAFGCSHLQIDGHNFGQIEDAIRKATKSDLPTVILAKTIKGKGIDFMENSVLWHYKNPNDEELSSAMAQLKGKA